jgi:hypothetical protein
MTEVFALLLIGSFTLPFAKGSVEAINHNIFGRHASPNLIFIVWLVVTLLFWYSILPH